MTESRHIWLLRLLARACHYCDAYDARQAGRVTVNAQGLLAELFEARNLRHTGNTFAASGGAGIKDPMARMGRDSERAAMIYQHEARGADQTITSAIDAHIAAQRDDQDDDDDGASGALATAG